MSSDFTTTHTDLTTDRLVLRSWTPSEITAVLDGTRPAHWAQDFPSEGDHVIAGVLAERPEWLRQYGHRQIIERAGGLVIGSIGLFWPPGDGALEIGYGIVTSRRGRHYAAEATHVLTEFAFTAPGVHTVFADVEPANPASIRVLEKAGFQRHGAGADTGTLRYTRTPATIASTEFAALRIRLAAARRPRSRRDAPGTDRPR